MDKRFILLVTLDELGDVTGCAIQDNETFDISDVDLSEAPEFVAERIALMKLTDVNKRAKGDVIGRKLDNQMIIVYLTYDEFKQIKEECKHEK